ncbi:hypothetical protein C8A05DRAFT_34117, partial [Staphylotrichum tortipilum]
IFALANTIMIGIHVNHGLGQPITNLTLDQIQTFFKLMYTAVLLSSLTLLLTKLSVLLLLLDIFVLPCPRYATYALLLLTAIYGLWLTASNIFFCIPIHAFWDFSVEGKYCIPSQQKWWADAAGNFALDVAIFGLPLPVVWVVGRTLPGRERVWLGVVFALGFLVCLVSVVRFPLLNFTVLSHDPTWDGVYITYWTVVEINVPIVIACIPMLRPLVVKFCPRLLETRWESGAGGSAHPPISSPPRRLRSVEMERV